MEKQANIKRKAFTFQPKDLVLIKLQPYQQATVHKRVSQKLAPRFFGPFTIIKRIREVAYLLDLPSSSRIHPIFHVSLLRPYFGDTLAFDFQPLPPHFDLPLIIAREVDSNAEPHSVNLQHQTKSQIPLTQKMVK